MRTLLNRLIVKIMTGLKLNGMVITLLRIS